MVESDIDIGVRAALQTDGFKSGGRQAHHQAEFDFGVGSAPIKQNKQVIDLNGTQQHVHKMILPLTTSRLFTRTQFLSNADQPKTQP